MWTPPKDLGTSKLRSILGIGIDLVELRGFQELLELPGSTLQIPGKVFTARELRRAQARAAEKGDGVKVHLATLWALKEAALKAWLGALDKSGIEPPLDRDQVNWAEIQVHHSSTGTPSIILSGALAQAFETVFSPPNPDAADLPTPTWHASASHDGNLATAMVVLSA